MNKKVCGLLFLLLVVGASQAGSADSHSDELSNFPETVPFTTDLPKQVKISSKNNNRLELAYFDADGQKLLYRERFEDITIEGFKLAIKLGAGQKVTSELESLQQTFAQHAEVRMAITLNDTELMPLIGIIPAGHSQQTIAILSGQSSDDGDDKHWKGFTKRTRVTSIQKVNLGVEKLTGQEQIISKSPYLAEMVGPVLSKSAFELPVTTQKAFQQRETNRPRHEDLFDKDGNRFGTTPANQTDPLINLSIQRPSQFLTPTADVNVDGMPNISGFLPPDTEGAVGPNHFVQMINSTYQIFDKTGASVAGPFNNNSLWSGFGGRCESDNSGDPIVLYHEQADRWILTQFAVGGAPESVCFAVSTTPDPTGTYYLYQLISQRFPDYYKLGLWPVAGNNAIFMGTNSGFQGAYDVYAIDIENMLLGIPARSAQFFQGYPNLLMPADTDGIPAAAGTPGYLYTIRDGGEPYFGSPPNDSIDVYEFDVDWDTPANTTFTLAQVITNADGLADFNWTVCGFFQTNCLEQPGTSILIDSNSWWPQQRLQYRNFGSYGALVGAWGVNAVAQPAKRSAIRWFELRKSSAGGNWSIFQQGTHTPDTDHRFSPSISMDSAGNIGLGYSVTSSSTFPSLRYAVHDSSVDAPGVMEPEEELVAGLGSQLSTSGRWGDYASMDVDPVDGCTFWFTSEYMPSTSNGNWQTRIGSFKVPSCEQFRVVPDVSELQVCALTDPTATFSLTLTDDFNGTTNMSQSGCPTGATCGFSPNPVNFPTLDTDFNLSDLDSANSGSYLMTVTAEDSLDNSKTGDVDLLLDLFVNTPTQPVAVSPINDAFVNSSSPLLDWANVSHEQSYLLEVSDQSDFSNIVFSTSTEQSQFNASGLQESTCYFWRVSPSNTCGSGIMSNTSQFYTGTTAASADLLSPNVPVTISAVGPDTITSTLNVSGVGVITDVDVVDLVITHTYVSDLSIDLESPSGTVVRLMNVGCGSRDDVDINLDDEAAATWTCPSGNPSIPVGNGGTFLPTSPLAAFDGENADGIWTITVIDGFNLDGGSLDSWGLNFEFYSDPGNQCPVVSTPPTAVDDVASVLEDAAATGIDVQANDTDPDGGTNTIQSVTQPTNGTVVITNAGADLSYEPNTDYCNDGSPTDDFTYTLNGGSSATVAISVTCEDDLPTAVNDSALLTEDDPATSIDVIANDTDPDGGTNTIQSVTQAANGTVVITNAGANLTYEPNADYCNDGSPTDDFTYTLNGGSSATVAISVTCEDDLPTAVNDSALLTEDDPATSIDVIANDTDPDGGTNTIQSVTQAANGTVVITNAGANLTYEPNTDYCNDGSPTDDFTYTLNGGSSATVAISVTCEDDLPTAVDDTALLTEDDPATSIDVIANDTDPDGGTNTIQSVTQAANGTVVITNAGADLSYVPNTDYCNDVPATDDFTYTLNGGSVGTVAVTVTCVDDPAVANADAGSVVEDSGANTIDVLANDTDIESDTILVTAITVQPANGAVAITNGGADVSYTPGLNYCNDGVTTDDFTYEVTGGDTAVVAMTVSCVDDVAVANGDTGTVVEDSGANTVDVLANDSDVEGDTILVTAITAQPANGSVAITNGGANVSYTPNLNYCNDGVTTDDFTYEITDGDTAVVAMSVTCVDDPAVANGDTGTVVEDSGANTLDVLANDSDVEGDTILVTAITAQPANGVVAITSGGANVSYTPNLNYCNDGSPTDNFTYAVTDGDTAVVAMTVTCVDDGPAVAADDGATVAEDSGVNAIDVLANDTADPDDGSLSVTGVGAAANGATAFTAANVSYSPNANYCGADSFTYSINGGGSASVSVTVTCVDDGPAVAADDGATVVEDSGVNAIDVLANDTADPDDGSLSVTGVGAAANGATAFTAANVSYSPNANYCGADSFTYSINGGGSATVSVSVTCVDDSAVANGDTGTVVEDSGANTLDVLANDSDVEGDAILVTAISVQPANGAVAITNGGADISYTPNLNYCNDGVTTDDFTYEVTGGDTAVVAMTVTCVDDPAVANGDTGTVVEDSGANTIDVIANDSDPEGDTILVTAITAQPANGAVAITSGGANVSYTPNLNYCNDGSSTDNFTYEVTDGDTAVVAMTVTCVDDGPAVAADDGATVAEDSGVNAIDVLNNDTADPDDGSLTVTGVGAAANGSTSFTAANVSYSPNADYCGADSFSYSINGGGSATVSVTVTCVDDGPAVAADDAATVAEDSGVNVFNVLANDTADPDDGSLSVTGVGAAANGSTSFTAANVSYTPNLNYCGADSFTYSINGGGSATVSVTVTCVDDGPAVAADDAATVAEDSGVNAIDVLANDTADPDDGSLSVTGVGAAANGATSFTAANVSYSPNANYCGADSFTYSINGGGSATVTVAVTCVDDAPVAVADSFTVNEDSGITSLAVLDNDIDFDGNGLTIATVGVATDGTATLNGNQIDYQPNADFCGSDSFTYSLAGGNQTDVNVTINCVNDQPTFALNAEVKIGVSQIGGIGPQLVACQFDFGPDNEDTSQAVVDFIVNIALDPDNILSAVDVQNDGQLTYGFTGNQGVASIEVQLQDDGGTNDGGVDTSVTQTLSIHVEDYVFVDGFDGLVCAK